MTSSTPAHARGRGRSAFLAVVVAAGLVVPATTAHADTPTAVGWWTVENAGAPTEPVPIVTVPTGGGPDGLPSDIPQGGFEVANDGTGVVSYAAVGYYSFGSTVDKVVLHLAPKSVDLPGSKVEACPLTGGGSFASAYGVPLAQGPGYNCTQSAPGVENSTAGTVTFDAGPFMHNGYLGVAIVGVGSTRMVFSPPDQSTIQTVGVPTAPPGETPTTQASPPSQPLTITPPVTAVTPIAPPVITGSAPQAFTPQASPETQPVAAPPELASPHSPSTTNPPTSVPAALVAVGEPSNTIGVGSAAIGALVVLAGFLSITRRNRRALRDLESPPTG